MPRFIKGSPEALAWGQKLKEARAKKRAERNQPENPPEPTPPEPSPEPTPEPTPTIIPTPFSIPEPAITATTENPLEPVISIKDIIPDAKFIEKPAEVKIHTDRGTTSPIPEFFKDIIRDFFPEKVFDLMMKERRHDQKYEIQIIFNGTDIRSFVVDKMVAEVQIKDWCQRIKNNLEGKVSTGAFGIAKKNPLPNSLGADAQFFFRV